VITFDRPDMLFLLIMVPIVILIHLITLAIFRRSVFKFANFETLQRIHGKKRIFSRKIPHLLFRILFITVIVFAASGVGWWVQEEGYPGQVIFAVDTSGSMLAQDMQENRLDATRRTLLSVAVNSTHSFNTGLISFTSLAYLEHPPDFDNKGLELAIKGLDVRNSHGSSLAAPIMLASALTDPEKQPTVIVITDGQENILTEEELLDVIDEATERKMMIFIIGVGTEEGAAIEEGTTGKSVLNTEIFQKIKERNGGDFALARNDAEITAAIESFLDIGTIERKIDLTLPLYMLAFTILLLEWYFANIFFRSFP